MRALGHSAWVGPGYRLTRVLGPEGPAPPSPRLPCLVHEPVAGAGQLDDAYGDRVAGLLARLTGRHRPKRESHLFVRILVVLQDPDIFVLVHRHLENLKQFLVAENECDPKLNGNLLLPFNVGLGDAV